MSDHETLEAALRTVEPAVCLVPVRHLRRLLRHWQIQMRAVPKNPDLPWWVDRETVEKLSFFSDAVLANPSPRLLLMSDANDRMLDRLPMEMSLLAYWRLLFHAELQKFLDGTPLTVEQAHLRLDTLGGPAVREIRHVLVVDHLLHVEADEAALYRAFVLSYVDLVQFAPRSLRDVFPSLPAASKVAEVLPSGLDAARLLRSCRPPGSPNLPTIPGKVEMAEAISEPSASDLPELASAQNAASQGNHVRAAILYARSPELTSRAQEQVQFLVDRIGEICHWSEETRNHWRASLLPLLIPASRGHWSRAARCFYELQKIPTDLRGEIYAVDLVEWIRTLGQRPVRRPLPRTRNVLLLGHLRAAHKQLQRSDLADPAREALERLFHHAMEHAEGDIRRELAPVLARAVEESGLVPSSTVERVARDKVVQELLDRICERGYLRLGNIRDAIARNQLKMPDLSGPGEFLAGDPLLRTDIRLAYDLDGIHRRGEFYLRLIQRFSSIFFGTPWGRALTLYLAIPFGGAFLTLMFAEELRHIGSKAGAYFSTLLAPAPTSAPPTVANDKDKDTDWEWNDQTHSWWWWDRDSDRWIEYNPATAEDLTRVVVSSSATHAGGGHGSFLIEPPTVFGFGVFLLLMFHVPPFRRAVLHGLRVIWSVLRLVVFDLPMALWRSSLGRFLRDNAAVRFFVLYLGAPLFLTALYVLILWMLGASPNRMAWWGSAFLIVVGLAVNTRLGWLIQDQFSESVSDGWRVVRVNLIPGLIGTILGWFKALANWVERELYEVDETLRFRSGDSRYSLVFKAIFGLVWFPIAYLTRFVFYLLVEPQVNPVKHFPVVTVSHKVIWPMVPQLSEMTGFSIWEVSMVVNGIPGIFGFMAWELKENWRLYRANRAETLKPVMIGSHGESMRGLLRPGFHSGTLPKSYRKLRRAWRNERSELVNRWHHEIEHVAESIHRFASREMIDLLRTRPEWHGQTLDIAEIRCGCQRVVVVLDLGEGKTVAIGFENRDGTIEANFENEQDLQRLDVERRFSLRDAATGLFNMGGAGLESPWVWSEWVARWRGSEGLGRGKNLD